MTIPTGSVCLDGAPAIYSVENHPRYAHLPAPLWIGVHTGQATVVMSDLGLLEALVGAYRLGDRGSAATYRALREEGEIHFVSVSMDVIERAAEIRAARPALKTPDALHVATAEPAGCDAFVTNDKALRNVPSMTVIVLDDLL